MTVLDPARLPTGDLVVFTGPFTVADRDAVPDNGYRHELLDGMLVMQAALRARHQRISAGAFSVLSHHAPSDLQVL